MRFLVDAQLPPLLTRYFSGRGHESAAVREIALRGASDSEIWRVALEDKWVIVTKDEDFAQRAALAKVSPQILWLRIGNCSNVALVAWLDSHWAEIERALLAGKPLVEVLP